MPGHSVALTDMLRALARRAANEPGEMVGQILARLREDPLWVMLKISESLGHGVTARLYPPSLSLAERARVRRPHSRLLSILSAFLLHELGASTQLGDLLEERAALAGAPERLALARFCIGIDRPEQALTILEPLPADHAVLRVRGRAMGRAGRLRESVEMLDRALALHRDQATVAERERLAGNLRAVEAGWRPQVPKRATNTLPTAGRVLHLLKNSLPYIQAGGTLRSHEIALAQRTAGLDPVMVTAAGFPRLQGYFNAGALDIVDDVAYHRLHSTDLAGLSAAALIQRNVDLAAPLVEDLRPALLHPASPHENAQVALALAAAYDLPVVYEMRGFLEDTWLSRRAASSARDDRYLLTKQTEERCMREADHVVTLGEAMRRDLVERGVDAGRITVVPNGVRADRFTPRDADDDLRDRLGLAVGATVLGYVSSLVPYEGIEYLIDATRLLRDRGHAVQLLIVGDGSSRAGLERRVAELGLAGFAVLTGRVAHQRIVDYYALIDVFVVPRTAARVCRLVPPIKPVEAMAMQRPVAVSQIEALLEIVRPGETGTSFVAEDSTALADAVEPLIDDPGLRDSLGKAGREWVLAERTWRRNGWRYRDLYERLGALAPR